MNAIADRFQKKKQYHCLDKCINTHHDMNYIPKETKKSLQFKYDGGNETVKILR